MKILVYTSVFYPGIGGIENHTLFLVKEFVKSGNEVKVITEQGQDPQRPLENIEVVHSSEKWKQLKLFFWCDIIYMPNITLKGVWLFFFNPFKKWVISHNDFHLMYYPGLKTGFKKFLIRFATRNIAVSKSVAGFLNVRSTVIFNCYNESVFKLYPAEKREFDIVFVGRLVSQKGCDLLINACSKLDKPFTLNIIGEGYEFENLKSRVQTMNLEHSIKFLGFMQGEMLARTLNRHRIMVVPSLDVEGFGIVALEGLACGCQMLVSNAGGLSEAVGDFGKIFQMGDALELEGLLKGAMEINDYEMSTGLNTYLFEHSRESVAAEYLAVFRQCLV